MIATDEEYNDGFRVTISVFGQSPPRKRWVGYGIFINSGVMISTLTRIGI